MGYRLLGIAVWRAMKWLLRQQVKDTSVPKPVRYAAGLAVVAAIAAVVLSRREGAED
jgi:hypothetical protein